MLNDGRIDARILDNLEATPELQARVKKAGDAMTGPLTLSGAPTSPLHAASKAYVDSAGAGGAVTSVAGRTGAVVLTKSDVGLANVDNTADSAKPVSTAQQAALDLKAPIGSAVFFTTDSGVVITGANIARVYLFTGSFSQQRTATLSANNQTTGYMIRIVNLKAGGFTLLVKNLLPGGTTIATLAANKWADFVFDGTNWSLIASGSITATP